MADGGNVVPGQEQMLRANLAGDLDAAFFGRLDEQDFLFKGDMGDVNRPVINCGK